MNRVRRFWEAVEFVAWLAMLLSAVVAICMAVARPPNWKAAAILLFVAVGLDVVASVARWTHQEIAKVRG